VPGLRPEPKPPDKKGDFLSTTTKNEAVLPSVIQEIFFSATYFRRKLQPIANFGQTGVFSLMKGVPVIGAVVGGFVDATLCCVVEDNGS
jgi:hypothetical protein